ncbi:glycoside hydrolase family 47 protein [Thelephora ganbajun]|uniref:Glycoside hydrolase family 47 protein n=1 Tax=Thelephora ganbajun TaxID=370292 RepID=A0ACB6Z891_THEGA|nr:glycoside hydrolase family 47 protein [Thelephora ganbajun]
MFTWRSYVILAVALGFLVTLYRTYIPPPHLWPTHPVEEAEFDVPDRNVDWAARANAVKQAFAHAYHGYEAYAFPEDELLPLTNSSEMKFNGWGVTVFDSLDTMILMGFDEEFKRALDLVKKTKFVRKMDEYAPFFETVIRYLGGLMSAYALSKEPVLLEKADELARVLSPVFNTETGFPYYAVNPISGSIRGPDFGILAEIASFQLEYTAVAQASKKKEYYEKVARVNAALATGNLTSTGGMFPKSWSLKTGQVYDQELSVGAAADSAHEYTLKQYLLTGRTDKASLELYLKLTTFVINNLLYLSPTRHMLYVTSLHVTHGSPSGVLEHLSCFFPGLLALGAHLLPLDDLSSLGIDYLGLAANLSSRDREGYTILSKYNLRKLHMWAAKGLTETCYLTYADQPSGLGPEEILFVSGGVRWMKVMEQWRERGGRGPIPGLGKKEPVVIPSYDSETQYKKHVQMDYWVRTGAYLLRPETVESLYLLWRTTGEYRWRDYAWRIFESIEKYTKTESGYASVKIEGNGNVVKENEMPSFFLAETLKYLYLAFVDRDPIDLEKWVFNTEAHPLPVFEWTAEEKSLFGIP